MPMAQASHNWVASYCYLHFSHKKVSSFGKGQPLMVCLSTEWEKEKAPVCACNTDLDLAPRGLLRATLDALS